MLKPDTRLIVGNRQFAEAAAPFSRLGTGMKCPATFFNVSVHPKFPHLILIQMIDRDSPFRASVVDGKLLFNYQFKKLKVFSEPGYWVGNNKNIFEIKPPQKELYGHLMTITIHEEKEDKHVWN